MKSTSLPVLLLVAGIAAAELRAQDVRPVSVDLVVQDKKGIPVKDLRAEEIEVIENGVRRSIASLALVEGGSGANPNFYLFAAVWPAADGAAPAISVEFFTDGKKTGEGKADLLPPDDKGRMVFLGEYPTAAFPPGTYEAVVRVKQGSSTAEDKAAFTIVP
jgi:hypothetical protein